MKCIWCMGISGAFVLGMGGCGLILDVDADEYQPECRAGELECEGNTPRTCVNGLWEALPTCMGQTCVGGQCRGSCEKGAKDCANNTARECDASGNFAVSEACSGAMGLCFQGACTQTPPSCVGLPATCGPNADESCCALTSVPGGTYNRSNDPMYPATVSDFVLDRFEITVGRFRKFVEAYPGSKPAAGAGAHPLIAGSGWSAAWNANLPVDQVALKTMAKCDATFQTWTDTVDGGENLPMNCISWFEAFAFCAWDGGRLPTEAEWNYAAAGGDEQREYPWSSPPSTDLIDASYAVYMCIEDGSAPFDCTFADILRVGSKSPRGDGKWGQADLGGSMWEWNLDSRIDPYSIMPCVDCANIAETLNRLARGGGWNGGEPNVHSYFRDSNEPTIPQVNIGGRCARSL